MPYQGNIGWDPNNIGNPYIQWEVTKKLQGGIDLGFFKDRINISAGYALNRSNNQLVSYPLSLVSGFNSIIVNRPSIVQNTSAELSLTTVNLKTKDFKWVTSFNITIPKNKLVAFPGIENTTYASGGNGLIVGQPLGVIVVGKYMGLNSSNGRVTVADANGNPAVGFNNNSSYSRIFLSTNPIYFGGFNSSFKYKDFQLELLFYFKRGLGQRLLEFDNGSVGPGQANFPTSGSGNQPVTVLNRWQQPGDIHAHNPLFFYLANFAADIRNTDAYYSVDASFIRMKNVSLSWHVPKSIVQKAGIENMFVSLLAENLATITKYSGLDPESGTGLPPLRTITLQVKVDF